MIGILNMAKKQTFDGSGKQGISHFLYRILDSEKTNRFQFCITGLRGIHRNLKQQKNFNSHNGFFRESLFVLFPAYILYFLDPGEC